jgi:ABC-type antimicrobial peptide transport system permease subunit
MASIILIISVLIINKQINFALDKPIGYTKDNIIHFDLEGKSRENSVSFFNALRNINGVEDAGGINQTLIREDGGSSTYGIYWPGKKEDSYIDFVIRGIDENLMNTLNIDMVDGKPFSKELGSLDSYVIFNETAIKIMNLKNPVGTKINLWGEERMIIGVMKDFHTASIMQNIPPLVFHYRPEQASMAMVRIKPNEERKTLEAIKQFYEQYNNGYIFNFKFLDDTYQAQYTSEQHVLKLAGYFAYMAILISCLGLLGLAAFNAELRKKELGLRKVLGSSSLGILKLLTTDFLKLVFISILFATPIAWILMDKWLSQFVYKIDMGWWLFVLAGLFTMLIACITVSLQGLRTALSNPVKSLRTE